MKFSLSLYSGGGKVINKGLKDINGLLARPQISRTNAGISIPFHNGIHIFVLKFWSLEPAAYCSHLLFFWIHNCSCVYVKNCELSNVNFKTTVITCRDSIFYSKNNELLP